MTLKKYIKDCTDERVKKLAFAQLVVSVICVLALLFSLFYTLSISILNIPLTKIAIKSANEASPDDIGVDYEAVFEELAISVEQFEETTNSADKSEIENFETVAGESLDVFVKDCKAFAKTPSVFNLFKIAAKYKALLVEQGEVPQSSITVIVLAFWVIIILFLIGFIIAILGIWLKKQALVIIGHILSLIFAIIFGGVLPSILIFITFVVLSILLWLINKEFKEEQSK